jgi:hydroxymethylpyrimidine/phosphomethylpyrimidine kinase
MIHYAPIPVVLCLSGHDPTGGAGIQADIETLASMGCHCAPVVTALTVQDTRNVQQVYPVDPVLLLAQARAILDDMPVQAIKVGLTATAELVAAIASLVNDYPDLPLIVDPVLRAGGGGELAEDGVVEAIRTMLIPRTTLLTPNISELLRIAPGSDSVDAAAQQVLDAGCQYILATGADEDESDQQVENRFYGNRRLLESFHWERLDGSFHGSGCTLAASISGLLAQGLEPFSAVHEAQQFTWESLRAGYRLGLGQHLPNRLFWAHHDDDDEGSISETLH